MSLKKRVWALGFVLFAVLLAAALLVLGNGFGFDPPPEFKGFISGSEVTVDAVDLLKIDEQFVRIRIGKQLKVKDFGQAGIENDYFEQQYTVFEAEVIYDYLLNESAAETIYFAQTGTYEVQARSAPILQEGRDYVVFMYRMDIGDELYAACYGKHGMFDVVETDSGEVLYKRGVEIPVDSLPMDESERFQVTSTPENPVEYSQKIDPSQLSVIAELTLDVRELEKNKR